MWTNTEGKQTGIESDLAKRIGIFLMCVSGLAVVAGCNSGSGFSQPDSSTPSTFAVGGTVSGLNGTVVLQDNGTANLSLSANGNFTFSEKITNSTSYAVTVLTQPVGEICTVNNGTAAHIAANITNVSVVCAVQSYSVSGNVTGLTAGNQVSLKNNGGDLINVTSNTSFTFPTSLAYGSNYSVSVAMQPLGQACTITNPAGSVTAAVTSVNLQCSTYAEGVVYSFNSLPDGQYPVASLIQGTDGNFYGTTSEGGSGSGGTVYQVTPGGIEKILHNFGAGSDGLFPYYGAPIIQGADGYLYGTTEDGGLNGYGMIFKISTDGLTYIDLHDFSGGNSDGRYGFTGLIQGPDGTLFGMTYAGGPADLGTIYKLSPDGSGYTLVHSFAGNPTDGDGPYSNALTYNPNDGYIYGTTNGGGANSAGAFFKFKADGTGYTMVSSFQGGAVVNGPYSGLLLGQDGNFYGTTYDNGLNGYGTVYKVTPAGTITDLYDFTGGSDGGELWASNLVQGSDGNIYGVAPYDGANSGGVLFKITPTGTYTLLHAFGAGADGSQPFGLILGNDGFFYGVTYEGGANGYGTVFRY